MNVHAVWCPVMLSYQMLTDKLRALHSDIDGFYICLSRLYQGRVRQAALQCLVAVVKSTEKRVLYGYWSSFIPDSAAGGLPPLSLITVILKDPSPKVQHTLFFIFSVCVCVCVFFPSPVLVAVAFVCKPLCRSVHVHCRCCRPCWMAPIRFLL